MKYNFLLKRVDKAYALKWSTNHDDFDWRLADMKYGQPALKTRLPLPTQECAYWDMNHEVWSSEGINTVVSEFAVTCEVSHLAYFGVNHKDAKPWVVCEPFFLGPPYLPEKILRWWEWVVYPAAWILWLLILTQWVLLLRTDQFDRKQREELAWNDKEFCIHGKQWSTELTSTGMPGRIVADLVLSIFVHANFHSELFLKSCASHTLANAAISHDLWILPVDSRYAMHLYRHREKAEVYAVYRSPIIDLIHKQADHVVKKFFRQWKGNCWRVWVVFKAIHPCTQPFYLSFTMHAVQRGLIFTSEMFGTLMITAFFFSAINEARSKDTPHGCRHEGNSWHDEWPHVTWDVFWPELLYGLLSAYLAKLPCVLVRHIHRRRLRFQSAKNHTEWTEEQMKKLERKLETLDHLLIVFLLAYSYTSVLFVMFFLASVHEDVQWPYAFVFLCNLLLSFLIVPFLIALVYVFPSRDRVKQMMNALDQITDEDDMAIPEEASVILPEQRSLTNQDEALKSSKSWWDLGDTSKKHEQMPSTRTTQQARRGSTVMEVEDTDGFSEGDQIYVMSPAGHEANVITGFSSVHLKFPMRYRHPPGSVIQKLDPDDDRIHDDPRLNPLLQEEAELEAIQLMEEVEEERWEAGNAEAAAAENNGFDPDSPRSGRQAREKREERLARELAESMKEAERREIELLAKLKDQKLELLTRLAEATEAEREAKQAWLDAELARREDVAETARLEQQLPEVEEALEHSHHEAELAMRIAYAERAARGITETNV